MCLYIGYRPSLPLALDLDLKIVQWIINFVTAFFSPTMLVMNCYVTNYPQSGGFKEQTFVISQLLWIRNIRVAYF